MKPNSLFNLVCAVTIGLSPIAQAAVTNVVWYRLGENDAGSRSGSAVTNTTADLVGTNHLKQFGSPLYSSAVSTTAAIQLGSSKAINFNGTSQYLSNAVVSTAVNNFGMEAWVKPTATDAGNRTIVCNGSPTGSGWAFIQHGGTEFNANLGGVTTFGSGTAVAGTWTHLAIVRDNGTTTFYVNGVVSGTSASVPVAGTNGFVIAAHPQLLANTFFNGSVDEVRVFTFGPGQFSTNDLLFNVQRVVTAPATALTATNVTLNGTVNPIGLEASAWFQWGTTTNYGYITASQTVGAGIVSTNFAVSLTGLVTHAYHYRAVASNTLGMAVGSDVVFALTNGPSVPSGPAGGGQPVTLGQPSLELNFIVCTNGNYPTSEDPVQPPFLGEVRLFAGNFAPAGWSLCHGQLLSTTNLALYSILHTAFGGDGSNTFALPDTRSRAMLTAGQGYGLSEVYFGERGGATQTTLFASSAPVHTHPLPAFYSANSGPAGSGAPRPNRQPYIGFSSLLYILGNFPTTAQTTYEPFLAEMTLFAGSVVIQNAVRAEGQVLGTSQSSALYSLIRTNFGGNGTTTFAIPDLRGRPAMCIGQGAGLTARTLGEKPGIEFPIVTTNQMPSHQHTLPSIPPIVRMTDVAGGNQPQSLIQPSLAVRFLISTNGQVPSTSVPATNKMIGQIQLYAGTNVPSGWSMCDGQMLSVASHPQLFDVVSNHFGGDGVTTFALPNLAGRIPVGSPTGQPGATYGSEEFVMLESQLPIHTHGVPALDFQSWSDLLGLVGTNASFDADADGDGAKNGLEWATGTELTNAMSSSALSIAALNGQAKIRFSRNTNATDVSIHLQRTYSLGDSNTWSGLVTNLAGAWTFPAIVSEIGTNSTKSVEVSDVLTNNFSADYRLKITLP